METLIQQNITLSSQMDNITRTLQLLGEKLTTPNTPPFQINSNQPNTIATPITENVLMQILNPFSNCSNSDIGFGKPRSLTYLSLMGILRMEVSWKSSDKSILQVEWRKKGRGCYGESRRKRPSMVSIGASKKANCALRGAERVAAMEIPIGRPRVFTWAVGGCVAIRPGGWLLLGVCREARHLGKIPEAQCENLY